MPLRLGRIVALHPTTAVRRVKGNEGHSGVADSGEGAGQPDSFAAKNSAFPAREQRRLSLCFFCLLALFHQPHQRLFGLIRHPLAIVVEMNDDERALAEGANRDAERTYWIYTGERPTERRGAGESGRQPQRLES